MPELPEVQMVANSIDGIKGKKISNFVSIWHNSCKNCDPIEFDRLVFNLKIRSVYRRWKFIIIKTDKLYILCHLRMTGKLYIGIDKDINTRYTCSYFRLSDGSYLIYDDIRKFGGFYLFRSLSELSPRYGMDPYDKAFTGEWLYINLKKRKKMIKSFLLDQSILAGLGNIYIDEVLWESMIYPTRLSNNISRKQSDLLFKSILDTLDKSISYHGTTLINFSFDGFKTGGYKEHLKVFTRKDKPCLRCANEIQKIKVAGRGTYICKHCQK